jgi:hypothetical protein
MCEIWGFYSGAAKDLNFLGCYATHQLVNAVVTDVSEERIASIFGVKQSKKWGMILMLKVAINSPSVFSFPENTHTECISLHT